eukprot:m.52822 g.52822  ORF g.52822 m.52822 type:complete len:254 (-) comp15430_c0_seq5:105-866(-)
MPCKWNSGWARCAGVRRSRRHRAHVRCASTACAWGNPADLRHPVSARWCRDSARCVSVWDHGSAAQHPTITALHVLRCEQHSAREGVADPLERTTAATSPSRPGGLHVLVSSRDRITHAVFTASCVPAHGHGATDAELHDTLYHGQELAMAHFACDEFVVSRHGVVTVGPCGLAYWKLPGLQQMWHVEAFVGTTLALGSAYMILACGKTCRLIDSNTLKELKVWQSCGRVTQIRVVNPSVFVVAADVRLAIHS